MSEVETGGEAPGEEENPIDDIDKVIAAQQAHEARLVAEAQAKAEEEARQVELRTHAGVDYGIRTDLLIESSQVQRDIDEAHAANFNERLAQANELSESKTKKNEELAKCDAEFASATLRFKRIEAAVNSVPSEQILQETQALYEDTESKLKAVTKTRAEIVATIDQIKSKMITAEEMTKYNSLVARQEEIAEQITALEENPALVELLNEEANTENQCRNQLKDAVIAKIMGFTGRNPERATFVKKMVDQFLTEEFAARGINQIRDQHERIQSMDHLTNNLIVGLGIDDIQLLVHGWDIPNFKERKDQFYASKLIQNLVGGYGSMDATLNFAEWSEHGIDSQGDPVYRRESPQAIASVVKKHLGTFNLLRATCLGLGKSQLQDKITVGFRGDWQQAIDSQLRHPDQKLEVNWGGGPIIPTDATASGKAKIQAEYDKNFQAAKEFSEQYLQKQEETRLQRITDVEKEVVRLQGQLDRAAQINDRIKQLEAKNLLSSLSTTRGQVNLDEKTKTAKEDELGRTGSIHIGRRRELKKDIQELAVDIQSGEERIKRLEEEIRKTNQETADLRKEGLAIGDTFQISDKISRFKKELEQKRQT